MAAILAAILVGAATGSSDAALGGISMAQGAAMQQQINFTRANENEADRVGMGFLAAAGFDPYGMPDFFETMGRRTSAAATGRNALPEILQSHPVTTNRIAESRSRAAQFKDIKQIPESVSYSLTRERLRVLSTPPEDNVRRYYAERREQQAQTVGERYGEALASYQAGNSRAVARFAHRAGARVSAGADAAVDARPGADERRAPPTRRSTPSGARSALSPRNIPLTMRYAEALLKAGQAKTAHAVLLDLFNNVAPTPAQIRFTALAASSAGDTADAAYYMSEYHISTGNLPLSVAQLEMALAVPGITAVQRSRFQARLDEVREAMFTDRKRRKRPGTGRRKQKPQPNRSGSRAAAPALVQFHDENSWSICYSPV